MRSSPSALTPFVRSDAQGCILAATLMHPETEYTVAELERITGTPQTTVSREVRRLVNADVLATRQQGRNTLVTANTDHVMYVPMREIVSAAYGPLPVLQGLLAHIGGVDGAYIYGSWAARRSGDEGPFPRDVDVLVVGTPDVADMVRVSTAARDALGIEVNIRKVTLKRWQDPGGDVFLRTVQSRPLRVLVPIQKQEVNDGAE